MYFLVSEILPWSVQSTISYPWKWSNAFSWKNETETTNTDVGLKKAFSTISQNQKLSDVNSLKYISKWTETLHCQWISCKRSLSSTRLLKKTTGDIAKIIENVEKRGCSKRL